MATAGIDFGTTNSVVALWSTDGPEVLDIDNPTAEWAELGFAKVMPTVLGLDTDQQTVFGWRAKQDTSIPTLDAVKRFMAGADSVQIGDQEILIEQAVAMFFRHLRSQAAAVSGADIDRVVVTVPANSRGIARHRTRLCAQLAGLDVLTLINEPTAAAMAATTRMAHDGKVLVIDWGGGTLDVTALDSRSGVFIEQSSSGVPMLGGKDFDARFSAALLEATPDVHWTPGLRRQFAGEVERAKIRLSTQEFTNVSLPTGASVRVTRDMFDDITRPLVERLRRPLEQCIADSRWDPSSVDHVLLVGGTCKIPAIRTLVGELLGQTPTTGIDPMTAIAEGAAVAAAIMTGELDDNDFFVSTEHALGTIAVDPSKGAYFSEIIDRGHKLPATGREVYLPVFEDQETVRVRVIEGDPNLSVDDDLNVEIAEWEIDLPPVDRGDNRSFTLEYRYDVEGILHVRASDDVTGDVMLEETAGSRTSKDKRQLVQIASSIESSAATGKLDVRPIEQTIDPESDKLVQSARNNVIPFVDDAEADQIRELTNSLEQADTAADRETAKAALKAALSKYSYLL